MAADNVHFYLTANSTLIYLQQAEADTNVKVVEVTDQDDIDSDETIGEDSDNSWK